MKNCNSVENQKIKGDFVAREVKACFSYEMDEILKKEILSYEDIENLYLDCEKHFKDYGYESAEAMQSDGADMQEIFEWWIITDFLYRKLKEKGEPVLEWGNNYYWGRTCSGQAILLDSVISEICGDMEILHGQKYAWDRQQVNHEIAELKAKVSRRNMQIKDLKAQVEFERDEHAAHHEPDQDTI